MGWFVGVQDGITFVNHNGDTGQYHSFVMLMPERDSGFVLLANASGYEQLDQVDQIARGVLFMLNGKPPAPISSPPISYRFLYWAILLTPLLQILGIVLALRKRQRIKGWHVLLTVVLNLGAVFLLFGLSQLIPFPLPSMLVFFPELGYGLIAVAALGIGWSVIYTAMYLRARRAKEVFSEG